MNTLDELKASICKNSDIWEMLKVQAGDQFQNVLSRPNINEIQSSMEDWLLTALDNIDSASDLTICFPILEVEGETHLLFLFTEGLLDERAVGVANYESLIEDFVDEHIEILLKNVERWERSDILGDRSDVAFKVLGILLAKAFSEVVPKLSDLAHEWRIYFGFSEGMVGFGVVKKNCWEFSLCP